MTDPLEQQNIECPNCYNESLETGEDKDGNIFYCCKICDDLGPRKRVLPEE